MSSAPVYDAATPSVPKSGSPLRIILIVVIVLAVLCCCCLILAVWAFYSNINIDLGGSIFRLIALTAPNLF
jgi:hypothetical protein